MKKVFITTKETSGNLNYIQNVIDLLGQDGGTISLRAGKHLSGPLILKSNLHLNLAKDAELIFSDNFSLYKHIKTRWEGVECYALQALIFAENASKIKLSGCGTINGKGARWWSAYRDLRNGKRSDEVNEIQQKLLVLNIGTADGSGGGGRETGFLRPPLIQFKNCSSVTIEDLTLKNSPFWNTHILYSENVNFKKVSFKNPSNAPNTDGLDIDSSKHVLVDSCHFNVGDDCLCIKSGMDEDGIRVGRLSSDIIIKNCHMENGHGAIVIGSETSGGIEDVYVTDCTMTGTDRGIRIKTRRGRGGTIQNINFKNISMNKVIAPIVMNMFYRCGVLLDESESLSSLSIPKQRMTEATPVIQDVRITDVTAENISSSAGFFLGLPESPIKNLCVKNFSVSVAPSCLFEEPAMDFFYTKALGPAVLHGFLEDPYFENIKIENITLNPILQILPGCEK